MLHHILGLSNFLSPKKKNHIQKKKNIYINVLLLAIEQFIFVCVKVSNFFSQSQPSYNQFCTHHNKILLPGSLFMWSNTSSFKEGGKKNNIDNSGGIKDLKESDLE